MSIDKQTIETYNNAAGSYDDHVTNSVKSPLHAYYEKPAIHAELNLLDRVVLNVGCGSGRDNEWAHCQQVGSIFGIDASSALVDIAQENFPDDNFVVMDAANLGFRDEVFDVAYSSLTLHYLPDWLAALREARRVLRGRGLFVFSVNHPLETALVKTDDQDGRTARIGRTIVNGSEERIVYGDYLAAESGGLRKIIGTVADKHHVQYYHRTFARMIADINASGFTIRKLVEPVPLAQMKNDNPEYYKQVLAQPKFLVWVLQK